MPSLLVTFGTDGSKDWVRTPEGQKFALGPVSVLTLVSRLSRNSKTARRALDEFLKTGEVLMAVDDDRLWSLLAPIRARWAAGPFMPSDQGRTICMDPKRVEAREDSREVHNLNALTMSAGRLCDSLQATLGNLAKAMRRPSPSVGQGLDLRDIDGFLKHLINFRNETLAWGGASFLDEDFINPKSAALAFDSYESNMKVARGILTKAQQTVATINRLASTGKKFDAARARADIARVTTKVASICSQTELTEGWVRDDLAKLAARNDRLHGLFHRSSV
jgi:hypothetical protein